MEQLTEFVSKSFASDRMPIISTPSTNTSLSRSHSPLVPSLTTSFSSLPLFRHQHPIPFTTSSLHSMVDRLGGYSFPNLALPFFSPVFHHSSQPCPPVDLSLLTSKQHEKSPSASPERVDVCSTSSSSDSRDSHEVKNYKKSDSKETITRSSGKRNSSDCKESSDCHVLRHKILGGRIFQSSCHMLQYEKPYFSLEGCGTFPSCFFRRSDSARTIAYNR